MADPEKGCALRLYIDEGDKIDGKPVFEAIVQKAEELGMAGATVMRASMGFGPNKQLHTAKVLRLSADLPVTIEIVDTRERIDELLPHLEKMIGGGLATLEPVEIRRYGAS